MMTWKITYTANARRDLRNIMDYISYALFEPGTAKNILRKIMGEIDRLDKMPLRHPLFHEEPWRSQGLRFFPVGNYLVFYLPSEERRTVHIVRVIYGGRDIRKELSSEHETH